MSNELPDTASATPDITNVSVEPKMHVVIQHYPNMATLEFNVDRALTSGIPRYSLTFGKDGEIVNDRLFFSEDEPQEIEETARIIATKLLAVPGIEAKDLVSGGIRVGQHSLTINKGIAFSDAEIERAVVDILAETFEVAIDEVEIRLINSRGYRDTGRSYNLYGGFEDDDSL